MREALIDRCKTQLRALPSPLLADFLRIGYGGLMRSEGVSAVSADKAPHGLFAGASQGVESESAARRQ
jgi:hypothetical protein